MLQWKQPENVHVCENRRAVTPVAKAVTLPCAPMDLTSFLFRFSSDFISNV